MSALKTMLKQSGGKYAEIARTLGVKDRRTVWGWYHREVIPPEYFLDIEAAYGIDIRQLHREFCRRAA